VTFSSYFQNLSDMPKAWVKDYFKHILVDAAEAWILAKIRGSGTTRDDIVKITTEQIQAAANEKNEELRPDLAKV
jgi:hypothetical protein